MASQISRLDLTLSSRLEMMRKQRAIAKNAVDVEREWRSFRGSAAGVDVVETLGRMSTLDRCMYCLDSRACDVEHILPKSKSLEWVFDWKNLLWICSDCNRRKGSRLPAPNLGDEARVYDPCREQFWSLFMLDAETGFVAPRWLDRDTQSPVAVATLDLVTSVNLESVAERRRRASLRLSNRAEAVLEHGTSRVLHTGFMRDLRSDEQAIAEWFLNFEGRNDPIWTALRTNYPKLWRVGCTSIRR